MGQRKFVFRELVQNKRDVYQLISYAVYKSHKDEIRRREDAHRFETEQLKQRVTDADIIAQQKWITKISSWAKDHNERKGFRKIIVNVFIWIGGSISGGLGSLLIILVIGGIAAVCSPDTRKAANSALKHAVDFVLPEKVFKTGINPPINNTPASDNMSATAE